VTLVAIVDHCQNIFHVEAIHLLFGDARGWNEEAAVFFWGGGDGGTDCG